MRGRILALPLVLAGGLLLAACENSGGVNLMGEIDRPEGAPVAGVSSGDDTLNPDGSPNLSKIMSINFADARWDGGRIPAGEQCSALGGKGKTPMLSVNGVPEGTAELHVHYQSVNGRLKGRGDMGVIAFKGNGAPNILLTSAAGETATPGGEGRVLRANAGGDKPGYLPPCERGKSYAVTVQAVNASGRALATQTVSIGRL